MNNTYPYPYSAAEARKRNELSLWRESHKANIACRNASDGEMTRWNRNEFIGVLDDKFLPEWAKPKLAELQAQEQTDAPTMGGMNMK